MGKLLEVKNLSTEFKKDKTWTRAVDKVSFHIDSGEILGLVGESGCGKSVTSLSIMRLLDKDTSRNPEGEVLMEGRDILKLDTKELMKIRGSEISMIFQEPMNSLNPSMRVEKQLTEAILLHNDISKEEAQKIAFDSLELVGIPDPNVTLKSYPHQLSGGMSQRVMIAMAMSCNPKILIADEPTTALDVTIQAQILELMEQIRKEKDMGILMITHDLGVVAEMCSRVIVMYAGRIVEEAPVIDLFKNPLHPYTQGLIASVPILRSGIKKLNSIPGNVPDLSMLPKGCKFAPRCKYVMDICREQEPELENIEDNPERRCRCYLVNKTNRKEEVKNGK
ncbi:ABC transporter ATP-binding protein [Miniphocaeibacter halophilus]|uniref:ABC transporter ATP-binding protein n=1 Tax=Miniphocaeibacter halophilus TaxID=2931922 RepID=A0AC61MTG0_9FIRM|nr:ABC transporter ATP-binding protein [Miniphocaeibacter halophilus]QQK08886.1 ABC transporter ATP-binding protein [Miniphocaeibacter halophilus]